MNKRNSLAYVAMLLVGLISSLTLNTFAQDGTWVEGKQPQKTLAKNRVLQNYIEVSSLPTNKKKAMFNKVTPEIRSELFKFHLALQIVKRPNLSQEQKDLILHSVSALSADAYDKSKDRITVETQAQIIEGQADVLFTKDEAFKIFESLGGNEDDIAMLRKYQNMISLGSIRQRKKSFNQSTPVDMSNLWKVHLAYHLATNEELNKPQKDFILKVIDFVNPSKYESVKRASKKGKFDRELQAITDEAVTLFTKEQQAEIIYGFGDGEISPDEGAGGINSDCTCRKTSSGECSSSTTCAGGGCDSTWVGCGALYLLSCNGECRR